MGLRGEIGGRRLIVAHGRSEGGNNATLFDNIFLVSADIPESVFDKPDAALVDDEEAEHGLQSGVAALAVMTKRMHVLHADGHDWPLNASFLLNAENWTGKARL